MSFMLWGRFGQVIWGGYGHRQNPPPSLQIIPESSVQMHTTA